VTRARSILCEPLSSVDDVALKTDPARAGYPSRIGCCIGPPRKCADVLMEFFVRDLLQRGVNSRPEIEDLRQAYIEAFFALNDALTAAETDPSSSNMQRFEDALALLRAIRSEYFACKERLRETESLVTALSARPVGRSPRRSTSTRG
jgi:hypothetical protein